MNKKGFTLVELLAVVVILAVIAAIVVPNVIGTINKGEKDSFQQSAYGILTSAKAYYQELSSKEEFEGKTFDFEKGDTGLEFEGKKPTGGTVKITQDGNVEIYITNGKYCAIKEINSNDVTVLDLDEVENCGGVMTYPTINTFTVDDGSVTASGFKVLGACTDKSGISKYEFSIKEKGSMQNEEEATWVSAKSGLYTFSNLNKEKTYEIKMRCQNSNGVKSEISDPIEVTTGKIDVACTVEPVSTKWESSKTVKITYSEEEQYTKQYSRDNGKTWYKAEQNTVELKYTKPGSLIARILDGTNKTTATCVINKVDASEPNVSSSLVESSGAEKSATVGAYCTDPESGIIKYEYAISKELMTPTSDEVNALYRTDSSNIHKFTNLEINGLYYIYTRCTNGAGISSTADALQIIVSDKESPKCKIDKAGYSSTGKTVNIIYPQNYINEYRIVSGDKKSIGTVNGNEVESNKWITATSLNMNVEVNGTSDVYARITTANGEHVQTVCSVNGIDQSKPTLQLETKQPNGSWYNKDKEILIQKNDEGGSGLKAYYVSKTNKEPKSNSSCGDTFKEDAWICDNAKTTSIYRGLENVPSKGSETYYVWVMDGAGNISDGKSITIDKIEQTKPTCTLKVTEGTIGNNNWYTSNVKVQIISKDEKSGTDFLSSGVNSYGIVVNQTGVKPSAIYNSTSNAVTIVNDGTNYVYGFVKDNAGNVNECGVLVVKEDKTKPNCAITNQTINRTDSSTVIGTYKIGSWSNYYIKSQITAIDKVSKVSKVEIKPSGAAGTSSVNYKDENKNEVRETYLLKKEGLSYITAEITDYAGNVTECEKVQIKTDYTIPKCELTITSGTKGTNDWYTSDVTLGWTSKTDELSGIYQYGINLKEKFDNTTIYTLKDNTVASGIPIYGYVKDNAGNISTCSKIVKRDVNAPEISPKENITDYTSGDTSKDIISYFNLTYGKSGGTYTCNYNGKNVIKISELGKNHRADVICTAISGAGIKKSATTTFRYYYAATVKYYCDSNWSLNGTTCSKENSGDNCDKCGSTSDYCSSCNSCSWATGTYQCNCKNENYNYICGTHSCNCTTKSAYVDGVWKTTMSCSTCNSYCQGTKKVCSTCTAYETGTSCSNCGSHTYTCGSHCNSCSWIDSKKAYSYWSCEAGSSLVDNKCYF